MDFNSSGSLTMRYLTNPTALNQFYGRVTSGGTVQWFVTDSSGSIREIVNQDGTILDKINYDPFGAVNYESSVSDGGYYKFQGGFYSDTIKLNHYGDRWEDPQTGRWLSQDPIGFSSGDANFYRFEINGPTYEADPTGDDGEVLRIGPHGGSAGGDVGGENPAADQQGCNCGPPTHPIFIPGEGCFIFNPVAGQLAQAPSSPPPGGGAGPLANGPWNQATAEPPRFSPSLPPPIMGSAGATLAYLGRQTIPKTHAFGGGTAFTSRLSVGMDTIMTHVPERFHNLPFRIPTPVLNSGGRLLAWRMTTTIARIGARWLPVIGWGLLIFDGCQLVYYVVTSVQSSNSSGGPERGRMPDRTLGGGQWTSAGPPPTNISIPTGRNGDGFGYNTQVITTLTGRS